MPRTLPLRPGWMLFALLTALLLVGLLRQQVDPSNRALKAPDGPDAAALQDLATVVSPAPVLLVAFAARVDGALLPSDAAQLDALASSVAALPGVEGVDPVPLADAGLRLLPVRLQGEHTLEVARRVVALCRTTAPPTVQVLATGLPLLEGRIAEQVAGERTTIVPALLGVLLLAAFACYRRIGIAAAVLLPAVCAIAWTGGLLGWLGHPLDPVAALLDPVLLTIGVATSVHFVEGYRIELAAGAAPTAAARTAALALRNPALLATATTMVGLWSLCTSAIPAVVDFGLRSAFGVALTHLFAFLLLPALLPNVAGALPRAPALPTGERWLATLRRRSAALWCGLGAVTALAVAGLPQLTADNDPLAMLPADEPARRDHDLLAARLGGVELFHLLIEANSNAAAPTRLLPLLAELRQLPGVAGLAGPVLRGTDGALAAPLLLRPGGSGERAPLFDRIERLCRTVAGEGVRCAGPSVQIARDSDRLLRGLIGSLGWAMLLLGAGMVIGLRSLPLGLLALLPNLLPALWLYGGSVGSADRSPSPPR